MIVGLALLLGMVLTLLAALHFYWAYGGLWPAASEPELIRRVVGDPRRRRMPARSTAVFVALALEGTALVACLLAVPVAPMVDRLVMLAGAACVALFAGRGFLGYTRAWRARVCAEPFATYDKLFYSPLCLALGAAFSFLVWSKAITA